MLSISSRIVIFSHLLPKRCRMPPAPETIVIPRSRLKLLLITAGAALIAGLCAWLMVDLRDVVWVQLVGLIGVVFFALAGGWSLVKAFDRTPGLVIDATGIRDQSSMTAGGHIAWADIRGFEAFEVNGNRFVRIMVRRPEAYLDRATGLRRWLMQLNQRFYGSPLILSASALQGSFDDLLAAIQAGDQAFGQGQ